MSALRDAAEQMLADYDRAMAAANGLGARVKITASFGDLALTHLRIILKHRLHETELPGPDNRWLPAPPDKSGMYHVYLSDGGQIITPYTSPDEDPGEDSCGDRRPVGWVGLKDWNGRVLFYRLLPPSPENT